MNVDSNPKKLNEIGESYFTGNGQVKNIEIAFSYFKKAADLENPVGYYNLGRYYFEINQPKQALLSMQKAAALGYSFAYLELSNFALKGIGQRKSKQKAFKYLLEATKQGEPDSFHLIANFYYKGIGVKKDPNKAWSYYQKSADMNHPEGLYQLGMLYLSLKQNNKNMEQALHYLDKSATLLHPLAILELKNIYQSKHRYFSKKSSAYLREMVFYYQELSAKAGNIDDLKEVSMTYYFGSDIIKVNYEKSLTYFTDLASKKIDVGYYGLGLHYLYQKEVKQDLSKAYQLFELAKNLNYPKAYSRLGDIERAEAEDSVHFEKAKDYYVEGAKLGDDDALLQLGLLHYRAQVKSATFELAFQYMTSAYKKGNTQAAYWLGIFYDKGVGTKRNAALAKKHFEKALEQKHTGAIYKYACFMYDEIKAEKRLTKSGQKKLTKAYEMLLDYCDLEDASKLNKAYSYQTIADAFETGYGVKTNPLAARYYTEKAAELNLTTSLIKMFLLLKEKELENALSYLNKAVSINDDAEAFYQYGLLFLNGFQTIEKNIDRAKMYLEKAAKMGHKSALEKIMMM
ncbi:MAG: tetratricopeptide repeat protein [Candidatus Izemoplasmatales bacterium]